MRRASLGFAYIKDFKSFIGEHEIILSEDPGLKYIGGVNKETPRLGSNGAGKSTFWDAIIWCWTGYSVRGHRSADLVSWGKKSPQVITAVTIDGVTHTIDRTGSPNKLFLDEKPAEQSEIDVLLLPRESLLHSVVFGQSAKLFYDLSVPERGALLDEVLQLDVWLKASDRAGQKVTALDRAITELDRDIAQIEGELYGATEEQKSIVAMNTTWEASYEAELQQARENYAAKERDYTDQWHALDALKAEYHALPDQSLLREKITKDEAALNKVRQELAGHRVGGDNMTNEHTFFQTRSICPTCSQQIDQQFRLDRIERIEYALQQIGSTHARLAKDEADLTANVANHRRLLDLGITQSHGMSQNIAVRERDLLSLYDGMIAMNADIVAKTEIPNNPYTDYLQRLQTKIEGLTTELTKSRVDIKDMEGEQQTYEYWRTGFKRVRLFQVKRVLDRLYLETANAANALGIGHWKIEYSTEIETKSGTMKPGVHITVKAPDIHNRHIVEDSGGEGRRVRLAVAMGLAALIQNSKGILFNFEVIDEPTAGLAQNGIDDLLAFLQERAATTQKSLWLIDHLVFDHAAFAEVWQVTKDQTGSQLIQLQSAS